MNTSISKTIKYIKKEQKKNASFFFFAMILESIEINVIKLGLVLIFKTILEVKKGVIYLTTKGDSETRVEISECKPLASFCAASHMTSSHP